MTPADLLSYLQSQSPDIPLKVSDHETIVDWQVYLDNLEETLSQNPSKKCYTTALDFAFKVKGVLEMKEEDDYRS